MKQRLGETINPCKSTQTYISQQKCTDIVDNYRFQLYSVLIQIQAFPVSIVTFPRNGRMYHNDTYHCSEFVITVVV